MPLDGKIGSLKIHEEPIALGGHPPVIMTGEVTAGQGIWPGGRIVSRAAGKLVGWTGTGDIAGVLADHCDTDAAKSATYLAHGMIRLSALTKDDGSAPTADEIHKLTAAGIYGV